LLAYASAWKLTSWPSEHHALAPPTGATFFSIFLPLVLLVSVAWLSLQFLLTVASLYASLDAATRPISAAAALLDRRTPELAAIAVVFLLLRTLASSVVLTIALAALQVAHASRAAAFALVVTDAIFWAVLNDFLLISRMAAYAAIVEDDLLGNSTLAATPLPGMPPNLAMPEAIPAES